MTDVSSLASFWLNVLKKRRKARPVTHIRRIQKLFDVEEEIQPITSAPDYFVSSSGRVFSAKLCSWRPGEKYRELKLTRSGNGYLGVELQIERSRTVCSVHRLVAEAFLAPPAPEQTQVRHLNGNPLDNSASNLQWGTPSENARDTVNHGRSLKGQRNPSSRLTEETAMQALFLHTLGWTYSAIGRELSVSRQCIGSLCRGESWTHLPRVLLPSELVAADDPTREQTHRSSLVEPHQVMDVMSN